MSSVDATNNNSNVGLYTLGAAALGAGGGVAVAYTTKPFLKDGEFTDKFIKNVEKNLEKNLSKEDKEARAQLQDFVKKIKEASNANELIDVLNTHPSAKDFPEFIMDELKQEFQTKEFSVVKKEFITGLGIGDEVGNRILKENVRECWDANSKKFVKPEDVNEDAFKAIKKAAKSMQNWRALIYGGAAAAVLGLTTFLSCKGKNDVPAQSSLDTQV